MIQDFFAISQEYKKRIESGENGILDTIKLYSSFQIDDFTIPMYCLGSGTSNIHYRLGELESGLFLATRELVKFEGKFQKACAERYAKEWEKHASRENLVSKFDDFEKYTGKILQMEEIMNNLFQQVLVESMVIIKIKIFIMILMNLV